MRCLALLGVAACSSAAPASRTPEPVPVPVDAAVAEGERRACVPPAATLVEASPRGLVLCSWPEEDVLAEEPPPPLACYRVEHDREAFEIAPPARWPSVELDDDSERAKLCDANASCVTFTPTLANGQYLEQVAVDPTSARVVLALHDEQSGPAVLELWDDRGDKRLARGEAPIGGTKVDIMIDAVELWGDAVLVISTSIDAALNETKHAWLFRIDGTQINRVSELEGVASSWAWLGGDRAVVVLDDEIAVVDLVTGDAEVALAPNEWWTLVYQQTRIDAPDAITVAPTGIEGEVAIVIHDDAGRIAGSGFYGDDGARKLRFPICHE